jgi:hypothetical protein
MVIFIRSIFYKFIALWFINFRKTIILIKKICLDLLKEYVKK